MQKIDFKKILIKLTKNWKFVVIVCILISGLNLYFIQRNLLYKTSEVKENPLFKTYKVTGNCFYQLRDSIKWLFLSGEEFIYPGSQIQSDENSHVILSFVNQSGKIEMAEKTLGAFFQIERDLIVEFKKGEMFINYQSASSQKPIVVRVGKRVFKLSNSDLFITGDVDGVVSVSVEYGRVTMEQEGLTNNFEKGQTVTLRPGREFAVSDSKFIISTPLNYDRYSLDMDEAVDVRFAFSKFDRPLFYQLYLGESPGTLKEHFKKPISPTGAEFSVSLSKGKYYWQLAAFEKPNARPLFYSSLKKFFIEPKISIQPVLPLANSTISLEKGKAEIQFQWDNPSQLERVYIEVSDQKNFSNLVIHENVQNNNYFNAEITKIGTYYWRVSGFPFGTSDFLSGPSKKFTIQEGPILNKIGLIFPHGNTTLTTLSLKSSDISFQWSPNQGTQRYKVIFMKKKNKEVRQLQSSESSIKVPDLEPGEYSWYVQDLENPNIESERSNFTILKTKKLDFKNRSEKERGILLWEKGPSGTSLYRVEVMKIGTKSNFNEFFNPKSSFKTFIEVKKEQVSYKNFSEGVYAFKVYALDKQKKILGDTTLKFLKVDTL